MIEESEHTAVHPGTPDEIEERKQVDICAIELTLPALSPAVVHVLADVVTAMRVSR